MSYDELSAQVEGTKIGLRKEDRVGFKHQQSNDCFWFDSKSSKEDIKANHLDIEVRRGKDYKSKFGSGKSFSVKELEEF